MLVRCSALFLLPLALMVPLLADSKKSEEAVMLASSDSLGSSY